MAPPIQSWTSQSESSYRYIYCGKDEQIVVRTPKEDRSAKKTTGAWTLAKTKEERSA